MPAEPSRTRSDSGEVMPKLGGANHGHGTGALGGTHSAAPGGVHSAPSQHTSIGPPVPAATIAANAPAEHLREAWNTLCLLCSCASVWLVCSYVDATYTPRDANYIPSRGLIISYQWCMVGYASNLILTLMKVIFETNRSKLKLHMVSCYINILAATSYCMLWTGFSPIVPDVESCLYIPQRWLLYCFTAPAIIYILCQISDYTTRMRVWVIMLNVFMLAAGGLGTVPWISWTHKVFWYVMSCVPFPSILVHMWRMVSSAVDETMDPVSKRAIKFIRLFSITTWNLFPFVYFAAIDGALSLEISEPLWAALDWLTKMVYSSSLMEANFFTIAQRREFAVRAIEEANRLATIQQLSTAIERKDDFLSAMSHELRTPLNGIIGLSESLMAGACGQLPDKALKTVSTVKLSGKRLLQLINDILDAAKMKQGTLVIKHEKVDIKRLVTDVLDLSLPLVRKGVKLVNNVGNVPKIVGDNGRIVQILYNLVGNSAKFTRQGIISITAGVSEDNSKVYVTVSDTGVGIPKEKVAKIFGAFEQADMSTTRRYGGTGLGLHLVKELVKAHCGDITVESEVGVGSSFTVWLPISQDGAVTSIEEAEAKEAYSLSLNEPLRRISEDSENEFGGGGAADGGAYSASVRRARLAAVAAHRRSRTSRASPGRSSDESDGGAGGSVAVAMGARGSTSAEDTDGGAAGRDRDLGDRGGGGGGDSGGGGGAAAVANSGNLEDLLDGEGAVTNDSGTGDSFLGTKRPGSARSRAAAAARRRGRGSGLGPNGGGADGGGGDSGESGSGRQRFNTSKENLLTVSKSGFKVMKPFYRERFGGCMVLSVDDDPINQMVVENLLAPEGYKVEQAMSGSEALDFLKRTASLPDVILLDIMMPDMSGYEVCQEIRRRYSAVSIPIIMVSAKGHPEHVMKGLEAGSVDYVKKPFHRQELLSRIRAQVRNREIFEAEMESRKVTEMLKRILPLSVVQRLQQGQSMIADAHDEVSVLFADVAGWLSTQSLSSRNTSDVITVLNEMYSAFEKLLLKYQVFRVEHTGESYLVVSGHDGTPDHQRRLLSMAADMLSAVQQLAFPGGEALRIRIGLHTGPAYAGVVGIDNPRYCVFGDTVSIANALEAKGFANAIHVSHDVYAAIKAKDRDRHPSMFVPARKAMTAGPAVMDTWIYKAGNWQGAVQLLDDEERDREAVELEAAERDAANRRAEGEAAAAAAAAALAEAAAAEAAREREAVDAEKARTAALALQISQLTAEREAAQAEAGAARARADLLAARVAEEEAERRRLKESLSLYEKLLTEAREAVAAAARRSATPPPAAAASPPFHPGYPHTHAHAHAHAHPHAAALAASGAAVARWLPEPGTSPHLPPHLAMAGEALGGGAGVGGMGMMHGGGGGGGGGVFSPAGSAAASDVFSVADSAMGPRGPGSVVAGQVAQSFYTMAYPVDMFLRDIGLPQYVGLMAAQEVTPLVLAEMTEAELEALGVETVGARRRICDAARQYAAKVKSTARMMAMYRDGQAMVSTAPAVAAYMTRQRQQAAAGGAAAAEAEAAAAAAVAAGGSTEPALAAEASGGGGSLPPASGAATAAAALAAALSAVDGGQSPGPGSPGV
ncbi:hypothetical protein HYH03_014233 [Edaphochlamys debaryana]|uniref:histidine kinase n=1 Tax=Edaphochlamys debaryana TaxID=47281 RepID=A0A836BSD1_9CHLO|nr:hypothetical protein HYH03_014233 [Edaphochlamys debaryana]|eukprot:KAG2487120.1 hypothetical protein HYH03_014233 [Edaphochlamys debaryana]